MTATINAPDAPLQLSPEGIELLKGFEGFCASAYQPVPGDRWTIGYGFTEGVQEHDTMTRGQADRRLAAELPHYERAVARACTAPPTQPQFDAMVLLTWNIGTAGFAKSTVLKAHNRGDFAAAARAFGLWNKSGGKVYPGLVRRRAEEAALYLRPARATMAETAFVPRAVDGESRLAQSPINRAGAVAGGTAALTATAEALRAAGSVRDSAAALGPWLLPLAALVIVLATGIIIAQRIKQRREGWA